jgi:ADP-heptose:LPS heptosyltransferase
VDDRPGPFDPKAVRKILVVRADNIGDVICTTPALDALRAAFPQARIAALVCTLTEQALSGHRALDHLYSYPKTKHKKYGFARSLWMLGQTLASIRREDFDLAVSFRADFSTSQGWLAYASRARWRLGVGASGKKRRWGFFYNLPAPAIPTGIHEVERCFNLLRLVQVDSSAKRLYLKVPRPAAESVERFLLASGLGEGARPLVLNVTRWAYRPDRLWPPERYRRLAQALAQRPQGLVITHAPADREWVAELLGGSRPAPAVFSSPSLKEFAALLARGRVVITAEGGPMHLAAAVNTPPVVLWGRTPLNVWRPWGVAHRIVGGQGPVSDISVDEVIASLDDLLAETATTPGGGNSEN